MVCREPECEGFKPKHEPLGECEGLKPSHKGLSTKRTGVDKRVLSKTGRHLCVNVRGENEEPVYFFASAFYKIDSLLRRFYLGTENKIPVFQIGPISHARQHEKLHT